MPPPSIAPPASVSVPGLERHLNTSSDLPESRGLSDHARTMDGQVPSGDASSRVSPPQQQQSQPQAQSKTSPLPSATASAAAAANQMSFRRYEGHD